MAPPPGASVMPAARPSRQDQTAPPTGFEGHIKQTKRGASGLFAKWENSFSVLPPLF